MKRIYLYICTERKNFTFDHEIKHGLEEINKSSLSKKDIASINLISISLKIPDVENLNEAEIIENFHCPLNNENEVENLKHLRNGYDSTILDEEFRANDFFKISEYLHCFADKWCKYGETSLCIIWCIEKYVPSPSEVVEFYSALLRLQSWHNGLINIVSDSPEIVDEWHALLPIQIAACCNEIIKNDLSTFWRGSLSFSVEGNNEPTLYHEVMLTSLSKMFTPFHNQGNKVINNHQYVLPVCEVFYEEEVSCIPWAVIQKGSLCKLEPSTAIRQDQKNNILEIFKTFLHHHNVGTLIRIRYSSQSPSLDNPAFTNTHEWKQTMAEGNFVPYPSYHFEGYHKCLVLLILPDVTNNDFVYCIALQDYNEDIGKFVMQESLKEKQNSKDSRDQILKLLAGSCEVSEIKMASFSVLISNLHQSVTKLLNKNGLKEEDLKDEQKLAFELTSSKQIEYILFSDLPQVQVYPATQKIVSEIIAGKESWPEYLALEEAEKMNKKFLFRHTSGDLLCGLPPPISSDAIVTIDASQLCKYFKINGEAMKSLPEGNTKRVPVFNNSKKASYSVEGVKKLSWQDALHIRHHGIYYNSNLEQENFEFSCNRWCERHVRSEMASTCTLFQDKGNNTIVNSQKARNSKKGHTNKKKTSILSSSREIREVDAVSTKSNNSLCVKERRRSPRKLQGGVVDSILRRSNKRKREEDDNSMKPSDLLKPDLVSERRKTVMEPEKRPPKPANLSDVHKQKLRNAILTSLEAEGIGVKNELFKLCFKKLFMVCKPFALDIIGQGSTTKNFENIARSHVKQVIQFEKRKNKLR